MRTFICAVRQRIAYAASAAIIAMSPIGLFAQVAGATLDDGSSDETFTYNDTTGHWDSNKWRFDPSTGTYVPVAQAPVAASTTPTASSASPSNPTTSSTDTTGPGSDNATSSTANQNANTTDNSTNKITNMTDSKAKSGDANVTGNGTAGSATTGSASANSTVMNVIQSTVGDTTGIAQFTTDIHGNVTGDLTLKPSDYVKNTGPGSTNSTNTNGTTNNNTQLNTNNQINNTGTLDATSGNANVSGNTNAGSATTGDANAVANVMNLINTVIAANQSFIGTINIYGNLDGDILISPDFIPQLISDSGPNSTNTDKTNVSNNTNVTQNNNQSIVNNIKLDAATGSANNSGNTNAGSAATGAAKTNLTILNLTGHKVVAEDSLLVFINVLGSWVGVIVDAPSGATSAALGSGVTSNTTDLNGTTNLTSNTTDAINNNLTVKARSGDATVTNNTNAGDAKTGDATASANVLNMTSNSFSLSKWFGVLFINVFGTWHGSFGVNTENGDIVPLVTPTTSTLNTPPAFTFSNIPSAVTNFTSLVNNDQQNSGMPLVSDSQMAVLAAATTKAQPTITTPQTHENPITDPFMIVLMASGLTLAAAGVGVELIMRRRASTVA